MIDNTIDFITKFWGPVIIAIVATSPAWVTLFYQLLKDRRERTATLTKEKEEKDKRDFELKISLQKEKDEKDKLDSDQRIREKDATVDRTDKINKMYENIAVRFEHRVSDLEADSKVKDIQIKDLNTLVSALEIKVTQRDSMITDRDKQILALQNEVKDLERKFRRYANGIERLIKQLVSSRMTPVWKPDADE